MDWVTNIAYVNPVQDTKSNISIEHSTCITSLQGDIINILCI